jgi:hypothetical protein
MVWVYDRTKSLLVAVLMHASLDAFWLASTPHGMTAMALVAWYLAWAALLWALVAAVGVANRGRLTRQSLEDRTVEPRPPAARAA